jgi:alkylated DNA nucleotide flippase Atl1
MPDLARAGADLLAFSTAIEQPLTSWQHDFPSDSSRRLPSSRRMREMALSAETILARVRRVAPAYVTTYGDLSPGAPRHAGRVLSQMPPGIPWWRVVRSDGTWPKGAEQRERLLAEGVPIRGKRVLMSHARMPPEAIQ